MGPFLVVAAVLGESMGIGTWRTLPGDARHFASLTRGDGRNAVIMGRRTWDSLPGKNRPLPGRLNVVISRSPDKLSLPTGVLAFQSLDAALRVLSDIPSVDRTFVIGGAQIYRQALGHPACEELVLTFIERLTCRCDTFFPALDGWECRAVSERHVDPGSGAEYTFRRFRRSTPSSPVESGSNGEEMQYLDLVRRIITHGPRREDRTGTGTLSLFGAQMRFSLRGDVFPLLTTKRVYWRAVVEELLWFISGDTSAKSLQDKGVHIWDANATREFLDSVGLHDRAAGDLGPVYGFQWRHFGATYVDCRTDYTGKGVDQLRQCIDRIRATPCDRRIVLTAWNPADLHLMALPPCHMFCQFYVAEGELSCQMYQRSADMGLGVPFNIASYALLTRLVAQVCGLRPGDFVHTIGDAHVYTNHVDALRQQLERPPRPFPTLTINPQKTDDIDAFTFDDFALHGYDPHTAIRMDLAI